MQELLKLTLILQIFVAPWAASEISQPYCYKNITETSYKTVTKTRIKSVSSKNIFKKIAFRKDTQVEVYEDVEPVYKIKLERSCCEGYKLTDLDLCEPQCVRNGCPQHSKCVEPEVCECLQFYFSTRSDIDGKHRCEPICEKPCPEHSNCVAPNVCSCHKGYDVTVDLKCKPYCASGCPHEGVCVAPNVCSCPEGYKSERGSCIPICALGDQCQNGKCVAKDNCICNPGFSWNPKSLKCEHIDLQAASTYDPAYGAISETTDFFTTEETNIETSNDDIDPSQVFDENVETNTFYATDEYSSSTPSYLAVKHKCPEDYIFHKGQCRPLKFVSDEIDCWLKPCQDKNAVCLQNGTCVCNEGFKLFIGPVEDHNSLKHTVEVECLSAAEYEARLQHLEQDLYENALEEPTNWTLIFFIVLGVLIIVSASILLALKLFLKQTGEVDVEGKNLACVYDNRATSDMEKTVF